MSFWKSIPAADKAGNEESSNIDVNYVHEDIISPLRKLAEMTNTLKLNKPELATAGNILVACIAQVTQAIQPQAITSDVLEERPIFKP